MGGSSEEPDPFRSVVGTVVKGPLAGMPSDLAAAVLKLNVESQARAIAAWRAAGDHGQRHWRAYLNRTRNHKHRQRHLVQTLAKLITG